MRHISEKIILFDGSCVLCNRTFHWILKADKQEKFRFGILQDDHVQSRIESIQNSALKTHAKDMDSVLLLEGDQLFSKSSAALRICYHLGGLYRIFLIFWLVPKFIRDALYSFIAAHRYRWFGKKTCYLPDDSLKNRFI